MTVTINLDWSRLFGFDQATHDGEKTASNKLNDPRLAGLGAKLGTKPDLKPTGFAPARAR
jgi:hypothetical protein